MKEATEIKLGELAGAIEAEIVQAEIRGRNEERRKLEGIVWWCESCDEPEAYAQQKYFSRVRCNEDGKGLVLCRKCCVRWDAADQAKEQRS